jgi:hypothetical protein
MSVILSRSAAEAKPVLSAVEGNLVLCMSEKWSIPRCGTLSFNILRCGTAFTSSHVGLLTPQSNLTQDEIPELDKVVTLEIPRISFLG